MKIITDAEEESSKKEPVLKFRNPDSSYHSDIVNNVMDLFDGKFID